METKETDKYVATVQELIEHLQKNFKPNDKLCFFDEGGAYINLCRMPKDFIGERFFITVKQFKDQTKNDDLGDDLYDFVNDDDIIVY